MRKIIIAAIATISLSAPAFAAQHEYKVTVLELNGGRANLLNDSGTVVFGNYKNGGYASSLLINGQASAIVGLGGNTTSALAINNLNQVVGAANLSANGPYQAFLYSNGTSINLGTLGGKTSSAVGINESGVITGNSYLGNDESDQSRRAFIYTAGAGMQDIGTLGGRYSVSYGINDKGQVFGFSETASGAQHVFMYENGTMTDLTVALSLPTTTVRAAVATGGQFLGRYWRPDYFDDTGYSYQDGKVTYYLNDYIAPVDQNANGELIFSGAYGGSYVRHTDGKKTNLSDLIATVVGDSYENHAQQINSAGQILVQGYTSLYTPYTVLLTPVPEPETWAMLLGGLALLSVAARRQRHAA